jgi:polyphosphate kinase 2 (PPK2 family)
VLVVLQGIDAAGKDGTINKVMEAFNPQGCSVTSFKVPSDEELAHDYLWPGQWRPRSSTPRP